MSRLVLFATLLFAFSATLTLATELGDPTRPPRLAAPAPAQRAGDAAAGLTSVLISPERRFAVVDGVRLEEGDRLGEATVVEIRATSVLLRTARGEVQLRMMPRAIKSAVDADTSGGLK